MSKSSSKVFMFDNNDPEMQQACENARASFRYFWREVSWERRRIIPALDMACVKTAFSDGEPEAGGTDNPEVEQMWLGDVDFDGEFVSGVLLNSPNWLKSVKAGDTARRPLGEISDWMYGISGEVFGAYTVNLLRSRMGRAERQEHDAAWGLNFGDPAKIRVAPEPNKGGGLLKGWFGKKQPDSQEHPMSENMAATLRKQLKEDPSMLTVTDDRGWTFLHQEALAGNAATVKTLLEAGADPKAATHDGKTPLQLARSLGWEKVAALLAAR
ncbi:DUF2314 domain-containing protein [Zavarzinella formosa]|uniref:DUF2314 domain-containing protein n=1 Tax=Zavarzinella formosa TaxID=360055 RepID=UPI0002E8C160|nr:DUF2314 domain-containing protein [Zavarzinella formosa]